MINLFKLPSIAAFLLTLLVCPPGQSCELIMGYQSKAKLPLINKAPDNSGIYLDVYSVAAQKINCVLKVVRLPKIRVLKEIKQGEVDFYPGMKFTQERSLYVHFIANGLTTGRVGLSRIDMPLITHKQQLAGYSVLIALGGINYVKQIENLKVHQVQNLDIEKAARMLIFERGDFFATDPFVVDNFLRNNKEPIFKKHPDCCGGIKPMYIGFSKKSKHIIEINNPNYHDEKAINIEHQPYILDKTSIAHKFGVAVREVARSYHGQYE